MIVPSVPRKPSRAPMFNVPVVLVAVVAVLAAVHLVQLALPPQADFWVLREFAFVPGRVGFAVDPSGFLDHLRAATADPNASQEIGLLASALVESTGVKPWTALTYALLHASIAHLALNLLWLVAFGAPVARRLGPARFLLLLVIASVAGAAAQTVAHPFAVEPIIGASAGVSGVVAAAVRFVFQPGESLGPARRADEAAGRIPSLPLTSLLRNRPVVTFLAIWFVLNFVFGILAVPLGITEQAIAWEAHVGGFLAGLLLFDALDPNPSPVPAHSG